MGTAAAVFNSEGKLMQTKHRISWEELFMVV